MHVLALRGPAARGQRRAGGDAGSGPRGPGIGPRGVEPGGFSGVSASAAAPGRGGDAAGDGTPGAGRGYGARGTYPDLLGLVAELQARRYTARARPPPRRGRRGCRPAARGPEPLRVACVGRRRHSEFRNRRAEGRAGGTRRVGPACSRPRSPRRSRGPPGGGAHPLRGAGQPAGRQGRAGPGRWKAWAWSRMRPSGSFRGARRGRVPGAGAAAAGLPGSGRSRLKWRGRFLPGQKASPHAPRPGNSGQLPRRLPPSSAGRAPRSRQTLRGAPGARG